MVIGACTNNVVQYISVNCGMRMAHDVIAKKLVKKQKYRLKYVERLKSCARLLAVLKSVERVKVIE